MGVGRQVVVTGAAGYGAQQVMDKVTTAFLERQSEASRQREKEVQPEPATTVLVKKVADATHRDLAPEQVTQMSSAAHRALGLTGAAVAAGLVARGWRPMRAGLAAGMLLWVFMDEGVNYVLGLAAPATKFPRETHIRGIVGHLAFGAAVGTILTLAERLSRD